MAAGETLVNRIGVISVMGRSGAPWMDGSGASAMPCEGAARGALPQGFSAPRERLQRRPARLHHCCRLLLLHENQDGKAVRSRSRRRPTDAMVRARMQRLLILA